MARRTVKSSMSSRKVRRKKGSDPAHVGLSLPADGRGGAKRAKQAKRAKRRSSKKGRRIARYEPVYI